MDARENPYTPGAGTKPPALTGRDAQLEAFDVLIARLATGTAGQSMIVTGLRGVGKTVLLNTFEDMSVERDWIPVYREFEERTSLGKVVARHCHRVLGDLEPGKRLAKRIRGTLAGLGTFSMTSPDGFEIGFRFGAGEAPPEELSEDFTDLLVAVGEAAKARHRGMVFLFDEVQFLRAEEFGPFVVGLHRVTQKALPVTCVAVGLPSLPALAGEARSYAERLFDYPQIDRLPREDADAALSRPAASRGVAFEQDALDWIYDQSGGYPYFLQQYGKYSWDVAAGELITVADAKKGGTLAQRNLDDGFFLVRIERATEAERRLLRAMATLTAPPYAMADVLTALGKKSHSQLSVHRDSLIKKGLIYSPRHGHIDFTVPRFADYLSRRFDAID